MKNFVPTKNSKSKEKAVISIRMDVDLLSDVDKRAVKADISRNEFIVQCINFAIEHISDK